MPRRPLLPASLRSAEIKFKRACLHERTGRRELVRFFNRHPGPTFRVEPEGKQSIAINSINSCRLICETAPPDLPDSFAARVGDTIYNFRCVLDHVAWQLVLHGSRWPLPRREQTGVQFPIFTKSADFSARREGRLPGVASDVVAFIERRHNYERGDATNYGLLSLARLTNDDKHRELRFYVGVFLSLEASVRFDDCAPASWENPPDRPRLQPGAVVTNFSYRVTGPNPVVRMNLAPTGQIVDEEWRDLYVTLEAIKTEVREILYAPQIIAAVS